MSDTVKRHVRWKVHNLHTDDPPAKNFRLIFLRNNLLTYYQDEIARPALKKIIESLAPDGFLIIGNHEKIPQDVAGIVSFPRHREIFQKFRKY